MIHFVSTQSGISAATAGQRSGQQSDTHRRAALQQRYADTTANRSQSENPHGAQRWETNDEGHLTSVDVLA